MNQAKEKIFKQSVKVFFIFSLAILLFLSGFKVFFLNESYQYTQLIEINDLNNTQTQEILSNTLNYFQEKEELGYFNKTEQSHMSDVKNVYNGFNAVFFVSLFVLLATFVFIPKDKTIIKKIYKSSTISIFAIILLSTFSLLSFDWLFTKFHELFFNGNWQFSQESLLIQMFPQQFFVQMFVSMMLFSFLLSFFVFISCVAIERIINKYELYKTAKEQTKKEEKITKNIKNNIKNNID